MTNDAERNDAELGTADRDMDRAFLSGSSDMARLVRSKDWSVTPLGPVETWPQSLRTTVSLCLASNFPINIIWGPDNIQIYNDGYRVVCGESHPRALGEAYDVTWASAWPAIGEPFEQACRGETSYLENQRMFLTRNGYLEETFFTFSLSPIRDETGIGGVFHPVTETTATMLAERRTRALRDLTSRLATAADMAELAIATIDTLSAFAFDLPFLLWYEIAPDGETYRLAAHLGLAPGSGASPDMLPRDAIAPWPVQTRSRIALVDGVAAMVGEAACGPYEEAPDRALLLPISIPGLDIPPIVLIAGVSPRLPFDDVYRGFYELLAAALCAALATVRAREDERRRAEALAEIDRAKTQFFSNVSHEFRTPLTLMLGPLEQTLSEPEHLPSADRERIEIAHRNGQRLLRLVNSLLDFSRIEAGRTEASFEPTDIATFTAELASNFRSATQRAGLALTIDARPLAAPVYLDRDMWEKIVLNLLSNAFKFTFAGEIKVTIGPSPDGASAQVVVSDTGTGISAEALPHLFERFYRVEGAQGRSFEGSGIGLALVQELVSIHGGTIGATSAPGAGSVFSISLPLGTEHLATDRISDGAAQTSHGRAQAFVDEALLWLPDEVPDQADEAVATGAGRVLLADDNADMRDYVRRLLTAEGFAVETCADGHAAIVAARRDPPDLILSDVMMPKLDGFGLLIALRGDPALRDIPCILLSARAGEEARVEGIEAGADDYLTKPFSARELVARVRANLSQARERRESALRALNADLAQQIDIRQRAEHNLERALALAAAQNRVLEQAVRNTPLAQALEAIVAVIEDMSSPAVLCSILLLDDDGMHLRHGAAPSLPDDYNAAIDGIAVGPNVGSCGTAAHGKVPVYVRDIATDPLWADFRDLALAHGLRACWSVPILSGLDPSEDRALLGTFAMYYREPREPGPDDFELMEFVMRSAALVIERKRAEATLRDSETRLRLAVEAGQIGEWELDVVRDISVRAPRHDQIFGHDEPLAQWGFASFIEHVIPADRPQVETAFRHAARTGGGWNFECRIRRPNDGEVRWISTHSAPQLDGSGKTARLFGLVQDVTAQHVAQERLEELNEQLEAQVAARTAELARIWTLIPDLLMVGSLQGRLLSVNPAWTTVLGFDEATLLSRPFGDFIHPDFADVSALAMADLVAGRAIRLENQVRTADGGYRWFDWVATPVGDQFYAVARDISAVKEREIELKTAQEALRQSQKMEAVGQLTGGIAHDFNNMLAVVIGSLDLLGRRMGPDDARARRYVDAATDGAKRAALLTQRLLAFARQQPLRPEPIAANQLLASMSELIRGSTGSDIRLETVLAAGLWRTHADPNQLENALLNLAVNARDAMPDGGRLTIETQNAHFDARYSAAHIGVPAGQYVMIAVSDSGAGMSDEVIAKAFDPFFTTKRVGKGTGLGLSQVYGFVKQSGGHVKIYSEAGDGTTVKIYLPRLVGAEEDALSEVVPPDLPHGDSGEVILVVEDEPAVRQFSVDALIELGYRVLEADCAAAALILLDAHPDITMLFTDIVMPDVNGAKLAEEARRRRPDLRVLFTTGYTRNAIVHNGVLDAGVELIGKPFTVEELAAKVRHVLDAQA